MPIEVFKTNIDKPEQALEILQILLTEYPGHKINFDLEDCDKILRIEGQLEECQTVKKTLHNKGFLCEILE